MNEIDWTPVVQQGVLLLAAIMVVLKGPLAELLRAAAADFVAKRTNAQRQFLATAAREAVNVAEALGGVSAEKKAMAVNYVTRALATAGLKFDEATVDSAVEAALAFAKDVFYPAAGEVCP